MLIDLQIIEQFQSKIQVPLLKNAAQVALRHQAVVGNAALSIVVSGDEQLHKLNKQFRDLDTPTDVLSFPADYIDPESGVTYLGDVLISCHRAESQALAAGHSLMEEIQLLIVHGILHLLGYDHATAHEKARMWVAQAAILELLGIGNISIPS